MEAGMEKGQLEDLGISRPHLSLPDPFNLLEQYHSTALCAQPAGLSCLWAVIPGHRA